MVENLKHIRMQILKKSFREQNKELFTRHFIEFIKNTANSYRYNDGFVEWSHVERELESFVEFLDKDTLLGFTNE